MNKSKETTIFVAYEDHEGFDPSKPEKNLLRAILGCAVSDLKKKGEESKAAVEYFLNPDEEYIFSFHSVCNFLEINPRDVLIAVGLLPSLLHPEKNAQSHSRADEHPSD